MDNKLLAELNKQIQEEFFSSYLYLSMAAYCESKNWKGFANWFTVQAKEEQDHAMGFFNHLIERGEHVELLQLQKPETSFGTPLQLFQAALKHEKHITARINKLYELATEEKDYPSKLLLHWYITEQVEEEASAIETIEKIKLIGDSKGSLYMLDKELGKREYHPTKIT